MSYAFATLSLWEFLRASLVMQLYLFSMAMLIAGVAYDVWIRGVRVSFLDDVNLKMVEFTHPYIPSLRRIFAIAICSLALLVAVLSLTSGLWPLRNPDLWITIGVACLLSGSAAVLSELRSSAGKAVVRVSMIGAGLALVLLVYSVIA